MLDHTTAKGWLRAEEREELKRVASGAVPPYGLIINIGVEYGASIVCLRAGNPTAMIIGVDIDLSTLVPEVNEECKPLLIEGDSGNRITIDGVAQTVADNEQHCVHLLFVDGDHSYKGVKADLEYTKLVCYNGVVIFHDCYDYMDPTQLSENAWVSGVNEAVEEWWRGLQAGYWKELPRCGTMRMFHRIK